MDAWELVPEARIRQDVGRFVSVLDAIIAADGAYVGDLDLRNGHRRDMQRLVRGRGDEGGQRGSPGGDEDTGAGGDLGCHGQMGGDFDQFGHIG